METEPSYTDDVRGAEVPARGGGGGDAGDHAGGAAVCGVEGRNSEAILAQEP